MKMTPIPPMPKPPASDKTRAALSKGRATQQIARGTITGGKKAAVDAAANRTIGHTFHSYKGK